MEKFGMKMFDGNKVEDDVAVLVNLILQLRDVMAEGANEPTAYDEVNRMDWSVADVISYAESKYPLGERPLKCF